MKRLMLLLVLILAIAPSTQAQDACPVNVLDEISTLVEAQSAAGMGDTTEATALIADVRAELDAILAACGQTSILPETLEFPDGLFRIGYPADWSFDSPVVGAFVLSNRNEAISIITESNLGDAIPSGSQAVVVLYGNSESLFNVDDFDGFRRMIEDEGLSSAMNFAQPQTISQGGFNGYRYVAESDVLQGAAYAFDLGAGKVAFLVGLTPPGEFAALEPLFEVIVSSIEVGADAPSGTPLEAPALVATESDVSMSDLSYAQSMPLEQYLGSLNEGVTADLRTAVIAPDGSRIAWFDRAREEPLCTVALADGALFCTAVPETLPRSLTHLLWSPDSRYIAFSEEWIRSFRDPDLWIWDTMSGQLTNRSDDGFGRLPFTSTPDESEGDGPLWVELAYAWGPDGNLYFIRQRVPNVTIPDITATALYSLSPEGGEPVQIRLLSGLFGQFAIYEWVERILEGSLVVSPDARQIAFLVRENDAESPRNGVWILSLSGIAAPQQVITSDDLRSGMLGDNERPMMSLGLAWASDGAGLYIFSIDPMSLSNPQDLHTMLHYYDLESEAMTPLSAFSDYTEDQIDEVVDGSDYTLRYFMPRSAVLASDGSAVLVVHTDPILDVGSAGLWAYRLGDEGVERTLLLESSFQPGLSVSNVSIARNGTALMLTSIWLPE